MPEKSDKKWKWKSGVVAEPLAKTFSEPLPETEMEALRMLCIKVSGISRELRASTKVLREIRDELRKKAER